jgi:hypothetical protein
MDRALIDGSAAELAAGRRNHLMSRLAVAAAHRRLRAMLAIATLVSIALATEAGKRWTQ